MELRYMIIPYFLGRQIDQLRILSPLKVTYVGPYYVRLIFSYILLFSRREIFSSKYCGFQTPFYIIMAKN